MGNILALVMAMTARMLKTSFAVQFADWRFLQMCEKHPLQHPFVFQLLERVMNMDFQVQIAFLVLLEYDAFNCEFPSFSVVW